MLNINRDTYRTRLKRGWCEDRARNVIPIPPSIGYCDEVSSEDFLFISNITRCENDRYNPLFEATCCCGKHITISEKDLFYDVHCGCQMGHTSPTMIKRYAILEADEEYISFANKNKSVPSYFGWSAFRHI